MQARVGKDLGTTAEMAALVLEQVMAGAEEAGVALAVDLSRTEDSAALERVRALDALSLSEGGGGGGRRHGGPRLESFRDEHARLLQEKERLGEEAAALRERYAVVQASCAVLTREKSDLSSQVCGLQAEAEAYRSGGGRVASQDAAAAAAAASLQAKVEELSASLEGVRTQLAGVTKERDARLGDSKQFAQLRALMAKKNGQLVELKGRLAKHEPPGDEEPDDE